MGDGFFLERKGSFIVIHTQHPFIVSLNGILVYLWNNVSIPIFEQSVNNDFIILHIGESGRSSLCKITSLWRKKIRLPEGSRKLFGNSWKMNRIDPDGAASGVGDLRKCGNGKTGILQILHDPVGIA